MKKTNILWIILLVLAGILGCNLPFPSSTSVPGTPTSTSELTPEQQAALERIIADSQVAPELEVEYGFPRYITMELFAASSDPLETAFIYFESYADLYGLRDPRNELVFHGELPSIVGTAVRFSQNTHGLPVYASDILVHINFDGLIHAVNGAIQPWVDMETQPKLSAEEAVTIAAQAASDPSLVSAGEPVLAIYSPVVLGLNAEKPSLVWQIELGSDSTGKNQPVFFCLVDAITGTVVMAEPLAMPLLNAQIFDDQEATNVVGNNWPSPPQNNLCTTIQTGASIQNNCPNDAEVQAAFNNLTTVWAYFENTFGRNGADGNGLNCNVFVHYGGNINNAASWGGGCQLVFGDAGQPAGQGTAAFVDVVGHEYTHSVTSFTAALGLNGQPRTLNEHFSDFFGAGMINGDWIMNSPGGIWRDMCTPPNTNQPDQFNNFVLGAGAGPEYANTGIPNKASCLAALGGKHNGIVIKGIGAAKTGRVWYTALTGGFIAANTNLNGFDNGILGAAQQLANSAILTQDDVCQVQNALASVGLGNAGDCDQDGTSDIKDNCQSLANPDQADSDADGLGDVCDNCPQNANQKQEDTDADGFGNACDICPGSADDKDYDDDNIPDGCDSDLDGDGILNDQDKCLYGNNNLDKDKDGIPDACDNCLSTPNPDQKDADGDGVGDVCDNCATTYNPFQFDFDKDGTGNHCDNDIDNDGLDNEKDPCPIGFTLFGTCGLFPSPEMFYEITEQRLRIPIGPCLQCPWELPPGRDTFITLFDLAPCVREIRLVEDDRAILTSIVIPESGQWPDHEELMFTPRTRNQYDLLFFLAEGESPLACNAGIAIGAAEPGVESTATFTQTLSSIPPTATATPTPSPIRVSPPTITSTPISRPTSTPTSTPISRPTSIPTSTPISRPTSTPTSTPTSEPTSTPTPTPGR